MSVGSLQSLFLTTAKHLYLQLLAAQTKALEFKNANFSRQYIYIARPVPKF